MTSIRYTAYACFWLVPLSVAMAMIAEVPLILAAIPVALITGMAFLAANRALELLSEIKADIREARYEFYKPK